MGKSGRSRAWTGYEGRDVAGVAGKWGLQNSAKKARITKTLDVCCSCVPHYSQILPTAGFTTKDGVPVLITLPVMVVTTGKRYKYLLPWKT